MRPPLQTQTTNVSFEELKQQFKAAKKDLGNIEQQVASYTKRNSSVGSMRSSNESWSIEFQNAGGPFKENILSRDRLLKQLKAVRKEKLDLADQVAVLQRENKALIEKVNQLQSHASVQQLAQSPWKSASCSKVKGKHRQPRILINGRTPSRENLKELRHDENAPVPYGSYIRAKSKDFVERISSSSYK
mmetsp:Transcript_2318/g.5604  ORF Transcript_2318/g.5604 Transcript_2318/m.5604 type:complete len:189 (-) Transcript_2318:69-635(-)